jgi:hypothetical protein
MLPPPLRTRDFGRQWYAATVLGIEVASLSFDLLPFERNRLIYRQRSASAGPKNKVMRKPLLLSSGAFSVREEVDLHQYALGTAALLFDRASNDSTGHTRMVTTLRNSWIGNEDAAAST